VIAELVAMAIIVGIVFFVIGVMVGAAGVAALVKHPPEK